MRPKPPIRSRFCPETPSIANGQHPSNAVGLLIFSSRKVSPRPSRDLRSGGILRSFKDTAVKEIMDGRRHENCGEMWILVRIRPVAAGAKCRTNAPLLRHALRATPGGFTVRRDGNG